MTKDQQNLNVTFNRKLTDGERPADSEQNLNKTLTEDQQILNKTFKIKLTDDKRPAYSEQNLQNKVNWWQEIFAAIRQITFTWTLESDSNDWKLVRR